jgi:alpha-glucosidase
MLLLSALRGSIILYQGEELGLPQVDVPFERLQDPEAIANWPHTLSRDGARTPMPWRSAEPNAGFSVAEPWLPAGESHRVLAVDRQETSADSMLQFSRKCLAMRRAHAALRRGSMSIVETDKQRLVFERRLAGERLRCSFNLSPASASYRAKGRTVLNSGEVASDSLGPYAAVIEDLS